MPSPSDCLVIFDCDGVLVDSERLAVAIDVAAIGGLGWAITEAEVIERHLGRSNADVLADIEAHLGRPIPVDWERAWNAEYRRVSEVRRGKPDPDLVLYAAQQAGVSPERCVVVEDSRYGIAGAKAAGMKAIGFAGGITPAGQLEQADVVITDMTELFGAIKPLLIKDAAAS